MSRYILKQPPSDQLPELHGWKTRVASNVQVSKLVVL